MFYAGLYTPRTEQIKTNPVPTIADEPSYRSVDRLYLGSSEYTAPTIINVETGGCGPRGGRGGAAGQSDCMLGRLTNDHDRQHTVTWSR